MRIFVTIYGLTVVDRNEAFAYEVCKMAEYIDFFNVYIMGSVEMLFQFYFFARILKKKVRRLFYFLYAVCATALVLAVPVTTIIGFGGLVLLLAAGGIWICGADFKSSLLYAALVVEIMHLCYGIVKSLLGVLYPLMSSAVLCNTSGMVFMLVSEVGALILAGFCYCMVYRYFSYHTSEEIQYMFLVFIPILMIFLMGEYISFIEFHWQIIETDGTARYLISHWEMLVIQLLGIVSLFCILFAYKKLLQSFHLSTELSLLEQEEHSLNQYVEEAKAHYEKTKSFRHDVKNHITVVKELLQNGKAEQALHYIRDMEDMAEELSFPCSTNNPVVDILVGNKLGIAKSMGIDVHCSLLLPYPCGLRDIDLCIILSNALDNAIRACKNMDADAERYIRVSGRMQGDFLLMEVENGFQGNVTFKKGTGLSNVMAVAEKYHGAISVKTQDAAFVLHVLLIIPCQEEGVSR